MKLHEVELFSSDPEVSANLFSSLLGLKINVDQPGLKVFNATDGVDLNISNHQPSNKVSLSFLVKDINAFIQSVREKKGEVSDIYDSHLGLRGVTLADNDLCRIVVHSPTKVSPEWLQNMVG